MTVDTASPECDVQSQSATNHHKDVFQTTRAALAAAIPREDRRAIGGACKHLIDHGRLLWLRQQGWQVIFTLPSVNITFTMAASIINR